MKTIYSTVLTLAALAITNSNIMAQSNPASQDPNIGRETRAFLKALNSGDGKPLETLSPKEARLVLVGAQKSVSFDYSDIQESDRTITQDGQTLKIHIVKPKGAQAGLPVFMFFHGGGWVLGDYPTHKRLVRDLVVNSGAVAVFPDYTPISGSQISRSHQSGLCRNKMGCRAWKRNRGRREQACCCRKQCRWKYGCSGGIDGQRQKWSQAKTAGTFVARNRLRLQQSIVHKICTGTVFNNAVDEMDVG